MEQYVQSIIGALIPCAVFWGILAYSMHRDRSRYRNIVFLVLALAAVIPLLEALAGPGHKWVELAVGIVAVLFVLALPAALLANGVTMIRREGKTLQNLLSLALGIAILTAEIMTAAIVLIAYFGKPGEDQMTHKIPVIFSFIIATVNYGSFCFGIFALYTIFLQIVPRRRDFDYVIVLGAGLLHGNQVSKLLSDRIDKSIQVYHNDPTPPVLIPSGGKGSDEDISEAEAMAQYMAAHGIPEDKILREDQSRTTYENVENSKALIEAEGMNDPYVALVTSNYHVYRALRYCRQLGLKCTGIGSRVAPYYWPSASIREFIAIHSERKHLIIFILGWLVSLIPFYLLLAEMSR